VLACYRSLAVGKRLNELNRIIIKGKKVKFSLFLIKHQSTKSYGGMEV
jgi:hypothetical protein